MLERPVLSDLEIASGLVFGLLDHRQQPSFDAGGLSPKAAMERIIVEALSRPPCLVSFSGGRDSSAILALATEVARAEGLPLPIPSSLRFPECADASESEWQQLVVEKLRLKDWQRLELHDEMDIVGPLAGRVLSRHGLLWPFNSYFHQPIFAAAAGGSVLTGVGGDELFSAGIWHRENLVLSRRRPPSWLDPARLVLSVAPKAVRRPYLNRRFASRLQEPTWLRPGAAASWRTEIISILAEESLSFSRTLENSAKRIRGQAIGLSSLSALAKDHDVICVSPFTRPEIFTAYARAQSWRAFESRSQAMFQLIGDVLPVPLTSRATKASFGSAFFNRHAREFVDQWDGAGVDPEVVDIDVLRAMWESPEVPDAGTFLQMQSIWLAGVRKRDAGVTPDDRTAQPIPPAANPMIEGG